MTKISSLEVIVKVLETFPGSKIIEGPFNPSSSPSEKPENGSKKPDQVPGSGGSPLVNRFISRRNGVKNLEVFPKSCRLVRDFKGESHHPGLKAMIYSFSARSKRNLKFTASNALPALITQFCLTYHESMPSGREVKRHVDLFLQRLRRRYPGCGYLWVLEFQGRGFPHLHLFLTLPFDTEGLHRFLAESWNEIVEPESYKHLLFHLHNKNLIDWSMGSGSYLCKYLDKEHQKKVPPGFYNVGRFWGCSRGLVPSPEIVVPQEVDEKYSKEFVDDETGEIESFNASNYVIRTICKAHERSIRRSKWRSRARSAKTNYLLMNGGTHYKTVVKYLEGD